MDQDEQQKNLNTKYQKLATEYAKLRSQVQVLKKAVLDEQHLTSSLKETVTSQDQSIRKLEQELDSVKFRNRQLEKRIEILQQQDNNTQPLSNNLQLDSNVVMHVEQNKQLQESLALLTEKYNAETTRLKRMIDHEMVPRELLDSLKQEHQEKSSLLNKRVKELCAVNSELLDKITTLELEKNESKEGTLDGVELGHNELLERLVHCEVEKEKLVSELQILKYKLKRYNPNDPKEPGCAVIENMIGRSVGGGAESDDLVIKVLRERTEELVKLLRLSDSKAVYYYHEAHSLCRLVRTGQLSYKRLDGEFNKLKVKYRGVQDELDDIKNGYESQVNSLTEHIAILNEKLASMVEERQRRK